MQLSCILHSGGFRARFSIFHASWPSHRALLLPSIISSTSSGSCVRSLGRVKSCPRDKDHFCDTQQIHFCYHRPVCVRTLCQAADSAALGGTATWQLSESQWQQVDVFVDKLQEWNQKMNLTAVSGRDAILERHVADSLALLPFLDEAAARHPEQPFSLIDVGSGAGLPGLPIAIARPEWRVSLLDSLNKRCDFLRHVIASARLSNVSVVCARAEDAGRSPELRERHKAAVARAVADMRVLAELCLPLIEVGGTFVAAKGPNPQGEVEGAAKAVSLLGGQLVGIAPVSQVTADRVMTAVTYRKIHRTDSKYPRRAGTPSKRPL